MAKGTDKDIFKEKDTLNLRTSTKGRPKVNRDLVISLLKGGYSTQYITKALKCDSRTIRRIKKEVNGEAKDINILELEKEGLDFDEECNKAVGISFYDWIKSRAVNYKRIFTFCKNCWEMWGKPSLVLIRDYKDPLGDQVCMKFLDLFGKDSRRMRDRKKLIRNLFRFLGRSDLCDRYLTMTESREPEQIRLVPEITFLDFPFKLEQIISEIEKSLGFEYALALKFKIITQMRTGKKGKEKELMEKELMGIKLNSDHSSYLIVSGAEIKGRILAKRNEVWDLFWFGGIGEELKKLCSSKESDAYLFDIKIDKLTKLFGDLSSKIIGKRLKLHDLRKVSFTWLYIMGIPLEIATDINVGWKDLNTPKKFYLQFRKVLKSSEKLAYRENIPDWFREGLEEYLER